MLFCPIFLALHVQSPAKEKTGVFSWLDQFARIEDLLEFEDVQRFVLERYDAIFPVQQEICRFGRA